MKIECPFCKEKLDSKDEIKRVLSTGRQTAYISHIVICHNSAKHSNKTDVVIPFEYEK